MSLISLALRPALHWLAAAVLALTIVPAGKAAPIFIGQFDIANFTFDGGIGDGSVNTSGAPTTIVLTGSDSGSETSVVTTYTLSVLADATFSFYWSYLTFDSDGPSFDPFGYLLNGTPFQLSDNDGGVSQFGFTTVNLVAGDTFGFYIDATDDGFGRATASISGDAVVPEPSTMLLFGSGILLLGLSRRGKRRV